MAKIIKGREIVADHWIVIDAGADMASLPADGDILVPLSLWQTDSDSLKARSGGLGIWLEAGEEPALISQDLDNFSVIAIHFPVYRDGRGYSYARELRTRYGFEGEIRAIGDVLQDQLAYMWRCGFDAFAVRADKDIEEALQGLTGFSVHYQGDARDPRPIYARKQ